MAENKFSDITKNTNAQCKIVVYPWKTDLRDTDQAAAELSRANRLDISSQLMNCSYSKNQSQPAGTFCFTLSNSPGIGTKDWKDILKRGYWLVIYMSNDGDLTMNSRVGPPIYKTSENKRIRCIGYIDRVETKICTLPDKSIDVSYEVTGRDFGVVYEEMTVWHNLFQFDKMMLDSIKTSQLNVVSNVRINDALTLIHKLFYYPSSLPGAKVDDDGSLTSIGLQWILPREMVADIGFDISSLPEGTYWGALPITNFQPTMAGIAIEQPTDYLSGNPWDQLKKLSVPQFHELFCETDDFGKPSLTFRPIPWGMDQSRYPRSASPIVKLYKDLGPIARVPAVDLIDANLAEDENTRYNSFLATVSTGLMAIEDNTTALKGSGFPKNNKSSIKRHGFRPMHVTVDSLVKNAELGNGSINRDQVIEFNEILYDYWNNAIFSESGPISKIGSNSIKVGKVLKFDADVPYFNSRRYYIEGYTDTFVVSDDRTKSWIQDVHVTRGFEEADLAAGTGFGSRNATFTNSGEFTPGDNEGTKK